MVAKTCGYYRLSHEDSAIKGTAFKSHRNLLIHYGIPESDIYYDLESGANSDRVNFNIVLTKCRNGTYSKLVIANLERLTRKILDWELILKDSKTFGFEIIFLDDKGLDLNTTEGLMNSRLKALFAQYELEKNKARQKQRWEYLRKIKGTNKTILGYVIKNNKIIVDKEDFICILETKETLSLSDVAKLAIDTYCYKIKNFNATARYLNDYFGYQIFPKVPTRREKFYTHVNKGTFRHQIKFSPTGIRDWITHPVLRGHLIYSKDTEKEKIFYNNHQPLMSEEQWIAVQNNKKRNNRSKGFTNKRKYPLSSLIYCKHCNRACTALKTKANLYYRCRSATYGNCHNKKIILSDYNRLIERVFR